jgi:L,D-peptidoglycan transpeptidase YkuD (ErfK/YbiS/YcfS/YnhG family)
MHIKLINKKLYFRNYKVKCAIGKRGISTKKREGDNKTPRGIYKFSTIFYRKDRIKHLETSVKKMVIKKNMGWCDDPNSKYYNKLIYFPFSKRAEKLYIEKNIYDIIVVIDYNTKPIVKKKGSAIFLHVASKNYKSTRGCLAISKSNLKNLVKELNSKSKVSIF